MFRLTKKISADETRVINRPSPPGVHRCDDNSPLILLNSPLIRLNSPLIRLNSPLILLSCYETLTGNDVR
jgi:hypothetical protein